MFKRRIWLLTAFVVCIAAAVAVAVLVAGSSSSAAATAGTDPGAPTTNFDANMQPPSVYPVCFVSGSPYQMGYQYGQEAKAEIVHNVCVARANALAQFGTWPAVVAAAQSDTSYVAAETPEVLQTWHGIADGAGISYDEVRVLNVTLRAASCSTMFAWGAATKGGSLIGGANADTPWLCGNMYGCVLIAYPDDGNAYIDTPLAAGCMSGGRGMNAKGLIILGSGGQMSRPQDRGPGYPTAPNGCVAPGYVIEHADTAAQAESMLLGMHLGGATNFDIADPSGNALVIEQTAAGCAVRKPGDFGEKDYILATNFYETAKMRPANDPNQLQDGDLDDWYRYGSEEQLIKTDWGNLTPGSLMAILGCHNYYGARDPVTGAVDTTQPQTWHYDMLNTQPATDEQSIWTPGMRGISWSPSQRTIYEPAAKTEYIMTGNDDPLFAWTANASGEFFKLVLADNPGDVTAQALSDAQLQTWYGAVALHRTSNPSKARLAELNMAKADIAKGMNLQVQAGIATDPNWAQALLGQATSCFCEAQCYAEQAQGLVSNSGTLPPSS
jgi:hypothetical protein